jgi:catechol 2,3-dioxygenase-like lactoylglutathione lyase family enzyme
MPFHLRRRPASAAVSAVAALFCALSGAAATARAASPDTPFGPPVVDGGWSEAVISVSSLPRTIEWLTTVARWEVRSRGATDAALLRHWDLPRGARGEEALLCNPGDGSACVRLVRFHDAGPQGQIRSGAQAWEPGGVYSLMTRARDLDGAFARHVALGYGGVSDPIFFDYRDVQLKNVVLRGPDGVNLAIYERVKPALTGWTTIRGLSSPFNAMQMVRDRDRARDFYVRALGYEVLSNAEFLDPSPGPNNFGVPANLVTSVSRRHAILGIGVAGLGDAAGARQMEVMQFAGLDGRDLADRASVPNYGIAVLRFPTARLDARVRTARDAGYAVGAITATRIDGWGSVRVADLRSPDGVIVQLVEVHASRE